MSIVAKLASSLVRNDEVPNQELAKELCQTKDQTAIAELVQLLETGNTALKSDSIKVLYEIGQEGWSSCKITWRDQLRCLTG